MMIFSGRSAYLASFNSLKFLVNHRWSPFNWLEKFPLADDAQWVYALMFAHVLSLSTMLARLLLFA